jgi:hypothetical protein
LVVLQASNSQVYLYQGLTRVDPIVLLPYSNSSTRKSTVNYSFSNASTDAPPMDEFSEGHLGCGAAEVFARCGMSGAVGTAPLSEDVTWQGPDSIRVNYYVLQTFKNSKNVVTTFNRFARAENRQLTDSQVASVDFAFGSVTNKTISGSTNAPAGYTLNGRALGFRVLNWYIYPFSLEQDQNGISPTFSWASPAIGGMELYVSATAQKGGASVSANLNNVAPDDTSVNLTLPAASEQTQPANNAVGITNKTVFSWTPFSNGAYTVSIFPAASGPLAFTVYTTKTELTFPDLTSLGYPIPKGVNYRWRVSSYAPVSSINDLAVGVPVPLIQYSQLGYSGERGFTTAP